MSRAAFLDGLRRNPADLTAWLVYADWLDEQGDPTGAFVRLSLDLTAGRVPVEPEYAHVERFDHAYRAADPDTRELMAGYRSGLPVRLRVCDVMLIGSDPPQDMFAYAKSVVVVDLLAGRVAVGTRLVSEDGAWRPGRPVQGLEEFAKLLARAEAGRPPAAVGLFYVGHHPLAAGTILVGDAG